MSASSTPRPEFTNPPVSEVVLSVQFLPLAEWRTPHAGWYWQKIIANYPTTQEQPPLLPMIERFGEDLRSSQTAPSLLRFAPMDPDSSRFWFIGDDPTRLIQIQRDRFSINWRKVTGDETYPRYERAIRPRFLREWSQFRAFVAEAGLGTVDVRQCEMTYVNHIPCGDGRVTFPKALSLLSYWSGRGSNGFLPEPETFGMSASYLMPDDSGRLHFSAQRVIRQADQRDGLQIQLDARGRPASSEDADVLTWMDLGRDWIVRGFTDLTSDEAHKLWGRTQ